VDVAPHALTGTVVTFKGAFGFVEYARGEERPRVYFNAGDAEPNLAPPLRPGDEVAFTLAVKPEALARPAGAAGGREIVARRVRRTREAPAGKENEEFVAERNPAAQKFVGNVEAAGARGNQTMRMARGPDGTRGFAGAGRGRGLAGGGGDAAAAPGAAAPGAAAAAPLAALPGDGVSAPGAPMRLCLQQPSSNRVCVWGGLFLWFAGSLTRSRAFLFAQASTDECYWRGRMCAAWRPKGRGGRAPAACVHSCAAPARR
jgi:hypothetical protein